VCGAVASREAFVVVAGDVECSDRSWAAPPQFCDEFRAADVWHDDVRYDEVDLKVLLGSSGLDRMRSTKSQSAAACVAHAAQRRRCAASQAVCHSLNSPSSRIEIIQRDRTQLSGGRLDRRSVRLTLTSLRMGSLRGEYEHSPTHRRPRGQDRGRPARRTSRPARPRSGAHCAQARR
jgi:hypothetical protein